MHTGLLIAIWAAGVALLQLVSGGWLLFAVIACVLAASWVAPERCRRLIRRMRFLLLAIVVFFAGFTPGEALFPGWPGLSPSREGVLLAAQHAGRLVAVVCCVAILLERIPVDRLVSGLYALLRPIEFAGFPASRLAVRLLLVMRYVEAGSPHGWMSWLDEPDGSSDEAIHVRRERFGARDVAASVLCIVAAAVLFRLAQ